VSRSAHPVGLCRSILLACVLAAATITAASAQSIPIEVSEAAQDYDQRTGEPVVTLRMTPASAHAFAELTAKNVGRTAAMVIDGRVVSKPVIRTPILGGMAQISGHFTVEEARAIATALTSGTSKMQIEIVEGDAKPQ
jgi:preprotein translocase subunit SecD